MQISKTQTLGVGIQRVDAYIHAKQENLQILSAYLMYSSILTSVPVDLLFPRGEKLTLIFLTF